MRNIGDHGLAESRMQGNLHVRFGERTGETDQTVTLALRPGSTPPSAKNLKPLLAKCVNRRRNPTRCGIR